MRRFLASRPSPAMAVAFVALLAALSGTAIALPGTNSVDSGDIVNSTVRGKDIRNGSVGGSDIKNGSVKSLDVGDDSLTGTDINESTLGKVPSAANADHATDADNATNATNAGNANTVGGLTAAQLQTSSAFAENGSVIGVPVTFTPMVSTTITTHGAGRVLASASVELTGADADERAQCEIDIDGDTSLAYEAQPDDIGVNNEIVTAVEFARTLPAGTYPVTLLCRTLTGTITKDDAAINVFGLGA